MDEVELLTRLIMAANEAEGRLGQPQIDALLDVQVPRQRPGSD